MRMTRAAAQNCQKISAGKRRFRRPALRVRCRAPAPRAANPAPCVAGRRRALRAGAARCGPAPRVAGRRRAPAPRLTGHAARNGVPAPPADAAGASPVRSPIPRVASPACPPTPRVASPVPRVASPVQESRCVHDRPAVRTRLPGSRPSRGAAGSRQELAVKVSTVQTVKPLTAVPGAAPTASNSLARGSSRAQVVRGQPAGTAAGTVSRGQGRNPARPRAATRPDPGPQPGRNPGRNPAGPGPQPGPTPGRNPGGPGTQPGRTRDATRARAWPGYGTGGPAAACERGAVHHIPPPRARSRRARECARTHRVA
jgi:hypothetical protein